MAELKNTQLFWNKRFHRYGKLSTGYLDKMIHRFDDKIRWRVFKREVSLTKGDVILDVGCNHGAWSIRLAQIGTVVTGIDLIQEAIVVARKNAEEASVKVAFQSMDVKDINFEDNNFDKIVSITVMQHVLKDETFSIALEKFYKQLKKEGHLILMESASNKQLDEKLPFKRERSLRTHIELCEKAGFRLIKIKGVNHLSVKWYYGIENFFIPKKIKRVVQYIGLVIINPIDIFFSRFNWLSNYTNLKLMVFSKI